MDKPAEVTSRRRSRGWLGLIVLILLAMGILVCVCPLLNTAFLERFSYNSALARWQARGVQEYEIVVEERAFGPYAGAWTLHVTGDQIDVVAPPSAAVMTRPITAELHSLTVAGQFAEAALLVNRGLDPESQHSMTFDRTFGYPTSLESHPWPWLTIYDADWRVITKSLKIIKAQHMP